MWTVLIIIGVVFLVGLLARNKGDGFLDTLSEGCSTSVGCIIWIILGIIIAAIIIGRSQ